MRCPALAGYTVVSKRRDNLQRPRTVPRRELSKLGWAGHHPRKYTLGSKIQKQKHLHSSNSTWQTPTELLPGTLKTKNPLFANGKHCTSNFKVCCGARTTITEKTEKLMGPGARHGGARFCCVNVTYYVINFTCIYHSLGYQLAALSIPLKLSHPPPAYVRETTFMTG